MSFNNIMCRICLQDGASCPIFEKIENVKDDIQSKILTCLHVTVEDVVGYPRQICKNCNETLDVLCNFINKFKQSCKALEDGLLGLKKDSANSNYDSDYDFGINIKTESLDVQDLDANKISPITTQAKVKNNQTKRKKLVKKVLPKKTINKVKRNTVASSILEGEFSWNGEQWCLNANKTADSCKPKLQKVKKKKVPKEKRQPPTKLCDLCGEIFERDKLFMHRKRVHFNNPAKCLICSRICSSNYYLNRHMKRRHESNKEFPCTSCDKSFAFIGELRSHTRYVHDKIRKPKTFACKMCDKTYKCMQSFVIHQRSAHTGERPDICSVCGASFYHAIYLKEHMRLHTGETPFKCPVCDRGFAQQGNMKSHLRIHRKSELDAAMLSKIKPRYLKFLKA